MTVRIVIELFNFVQNVIDFSWPYYTLGIFKGSLCPDLSHELYQNLFNTISILFTAYQHLATYA